MPNAKYPTLKNAPITEALVDIRCDLPKDFDLEKFKTIGEKISEGYPIEKQIHFHVAKINLQGRTSDIATTDKMNGYRYESTDGFRIVQLRGDGYTFNRLKPYKDWPELRDESVRLWKLYKELAKPERINRIALRYINNLNAPLPMKDFKEYLMCPPEVPKGIQQRIISFFYRVTVPHKDNKIIANITQSLEPMVEIKDKVPIILNIDVSKSTPDGFLDEDIMAILEKLRNFKNDIFFTSITPKLLEIYL